jgi:hypothetical protein
MTEAVRSLSTPSRAPLNQCQRRQHVEQTRILSLHGLAIAVSRLGAR